MPEKTVGGLLTGTWVAIAALLVVLMTAGGGALTLIFATQADLARVEKGANTPVQDWQLKTINVRMANQEVRNKQTSDNLVLLLARFRVLPVPAPEIQPLPDPPQDK